jgi:hypothetical protein
MAGLLQKLEEIKEITECIETFGLGPGFGNVHDHGCGPGANSNPQRQYHHKAEPASALMGASWGQPVLTFQGQTHRFKVRGLKVGSVDIRRLSLSGDVYNLAMSKTWPALFGRLIRRVSHSSRGKGGW